VTTLVCFHAHPDDECIGTGGLMARAAAAGMRVVLVVATRGERGEPTPGVLGPDEPLWERRLAETYESAKILGAERVEFLGYVDSGMMGEPSNDSPYSFWTADVDHAAGRLAAILREEQADLLTIYDDHGGYGHPDHIQVHRVGLRAAELAGTPRVFQGTMNRDQIRRSIDLYVEESADRDPSDADAAMAERARRLEELDSFGTPEAQLTHAVDVSDLVDVKRAAMLAHRSQIADDSWFLMMPPEQFAQAFGTEWYIESGRDRPAEAPFATALWTEE
jgi:LmbE family N-acetylglucosaminyl deacetylase